MNPQTDDLIEDALRTYPLADVPPNLSVKIMGQLRASTSLEKIKSERIGAPRIQFRLTWMDYALGFFLALLPLVSLVIWATLPRLVLLRLIFQWQLIQANGFFPIVSLSLVVTGILLLSAFLFSVSFVLRPAPALR
jgi:hypothetical protein